MNSGRDYGKGAGKAPSGALDERTARINVFRKLFYGVGGSSVSKNEEAKLLRCDEINHRKKKKKGLREECLVELRNPKTISMFHALAGKQ